MNKICSKCDFGLSLENFSKSKNSKDGKRAACKKCISDKNKANPKIKYSPEQHKQYITDNNIVDKKCYDCKDVKLICEFGLSSSAKDGLIGNCKACVKIITAKHAEDKKVYDAAYYEKHKQQKSDELKYSRRAENPEKYENILEAPVVKKKAFKIIVEDEMLKTIKSLFDGMRGARSIAKELGVTRAYIIRAYEILELNNSNIKPPNKNLDKLEEKECKDCKKIQDICHFRKKINSKYAAGMTYEPYCLNCEKIRNNETGKRRAKKLRKENPGFALHKDISARIWKSIKGNKNNESCIKYLPYTIDELKEHLQSLFDDWMNWENYGGYKISEWDDNDSSTWRWSLDHIMPHSTFNYLSMDDLNFKNCWNLSNLRPYCAKQNVFDGASRVRHKNEER